MNSEDMTLEEEMYQYRVNLLFNSMVKTPRTDVDVEYLKICQQSTPEAYAEAESLYLKAVGQGAQLDDSDSLGL